MKLLRPNKAVMLAEIDRSNQAITDKIPFLESYWQDMLNMNRKASP